MGKSSSKHSSSRKKKSSKIHPEGRKKKKNRATKSKKLPSRKDYSSCSSDYFSSQSISSSSSEDEYNKSRSRRKSELKGSKKRGRERSSSKRDKVSKIKKPRKKKPRREPSSSSFSSDSRSCSTDSVSSDTKKKLRIKRRKRERSIDSFSSDEVREFERRNGKKRKGEKILGKTESLNVRSRSSSPYDGYNDEIREVESRNEKKSKGEKNLGKTESLNVRSRSSSPYDRYNDGNDSNVPIIPASNSSRRLRSVITVVKPQEDEENEGFEEETMQDCKGRSLSRRNDSIDGDNTGILRRDESSLSDLKSSAVTRGGDENKREEVSPVLPNTENDLESILRLKALENMIKFKGAQIEKLKAPAKFRSSKVEEQSRVPVAIKSETSTIPKRTQKASLMVTENVMNENSAITSESARAESTNDGRENNVLKSSVSGPSIIAKRTHNTDSLMAESKMDNKTAPTPESAAQASNHGELTIALKPSTSELINNIPKKAESGKSPVAESTVNDKIALTSASVEQACKKKDEQDSNVPKSSIAGSSSLQPTLEENSSKECQSTDKDGSQFEQKTMTVMRGGEMVEVTYKVYIPKKAPALARRSLRR